MPDKAYKNGSLFNFLDGPGSFPLTTPRYEDAAFGIKRAEELGAKGLYPSVPAQGADAKKHAKEIVNGYGSVKHLLDDDLLNSRISSLSDLQEALSIGARGESVPAIPTPLLVPSAGQVRSISDLLKRANQLEEVASDWYITGTAWKPELKRPSEYWFYMGTPNEIKKQFPDPIPMKSNRPTVRNPVAGRRFTKQDYIDHVADQIQNNKALRFHGNLIDLAAALGMFYQESKLSHFKQIKDLYSPHFIKTHADHFGGMEAWVPFFNHESSATGIGQIVITQNAKPDEKQRPNNFINNPLIAIERSLGILKANLELAYNKLGGTNMQAVYESAFAAYYKGGSVFRDRQAMEEGIKAYSSVVMKHRVAFAQEIPKSTLFGKYASLIRNEIA